MRLVSLGQGWVAEDALAMAIHCASVAPSLDTALTLAVNHISRVVTCSELWS
jgi:hypothetical protein